MHNPKAPVWKAPSHGTYHRLDFLQALQSVKATFIRKGARQDYEIESRPAIYGP